MALFSQKRIATLAATIACVALSSPSWAAEHTRHAEKHVHGSGALNFAIDGGQVYLELKTPGFDILGFETIKTDEQRNLLQAAYKKLGNGELWSLTPEASCTLAKADILGKEDHHDHNDHGDHHDHGDDHTKHEDHHDDHEKDHDKHDSHGHTDHNHAEGGHMDIQATYVYQCGNISKLRAFSSSNFFNTFPNSRELKVQGLTNNGQVFVEINRERPEVRF
ncbi:ZrgA family zinc uptake protein [Sansalvadorimonas verongulae]|uniref:ZrgA family zinc uptake protein n=1 Tax=Sansalvadorimonas verongulae TaxID=2172824 RepID=UPI0012BB5EE0|nr:DUF2796 domain-containing protein [Sansalvadorimonas verongulae]MTI15355.1 DUF2796 domain-containing protein [Sansalvadorimonas verongulae]